MILLWCFSSEYYYLSAIFITIIILSLLWFLLFMNILMVNSYNASASCYDFTCYDTGKPVPVSILIAEDTWSAHVQPTYLQLAYIVRPVRKFRRGQSETKLRKCPGQGKANIQVRPYVLSPCELKIPLTLGCSLYIGARVLNPAPIALLVYLTFRLPLCFELTPTLTPTQASLHRPPVYH